VISLINPMLRGWVNYFAVGHSSACFTYIKDWVEKKVRRHMAHARKRRGFAWEQWSRPWLYHTLRLFNGYRVRRGGPKAAPAGVLIAIADDAEGQARLGAFASGLRELGWTDGGNILRSSGAPALPSLMH
jgi:RNA-directed DNA polymerase